MVHYLQREQLFELLVIPLLERCKSPLTLLACISSVSFLVSALFMNDPACLFLTPLVIQVVTERGLPLAPYLIAVATSANLGAAVTPIGSPQNMIIASQSGFSFMQFVIPLAPPAIVAWFINVALITLSFRRTLREATLEPKTHTPCKSSIVVDVADGLEDAGQQQEDRSAGAGRPAGAKTNSDDDCEEPNAVDKQRLDKVPMSTLSTRWRLCVFIFVIILVLVGFILQLPLGWTCMAGAVAMVVLDRQQPDPMMSSIDGSLLLFFSGLFIVMDGFNATGLPNRAWQELMGDAQDLSDITNLAMYVLVVLVGSNIMSNVPLVLLVAPQIWTFAGQTRLAWLLLSWVSTIAGNLTLVGSIANLIVAEKAKHHYNLRFWEYTRVGMLSTLLSLPPTTAILFLIVQRT
eukprot:TRINITY_DN19784_c0_g2_i2.p1 TRINITY_DN19784_c0_g2~~TRINITY_DN19784_c0_g2_i2.p1  ORF type:complete len:405 (-),score=55.09 TRINITY_DN19784_c0_g2_i2:134-1348(-)